MDPICSSIGTLPTFTPVEPPALAKTSSSAEVTSEPAASPDESAAAKASSSASVAEFASASAGAAKTVPTADSDPRAWPAPILERNYAALRDRALSAPSGLSSADRVLLAKMEAELGARDAALRALSLPTAKAPGVELCMRVADIPIARSLELMHHWLRTSAKEAGLGPQGGGVPGMKDQDNPTTPWTAINDHTGAGALPDSVCIPQPDVDEACVDRELDVGAPQGLWIPGVHDCQTAAAKILEDCTIEPTTIDDTDAGVSHGAP